MIIVTGGAGFIGSCLVKYLNELGHYDIVIVDNLDSTDKWKNLVSLSFKDIIDKDILLEKWNQLPAVSCIYHLGANSSTTEKDADLLLKNNYQYTKYLCSKAIASNARFIYASSAATYGLGEHGYDDVETGIANLKPLNIYGYSKHLFDLYAQRSDWFNRHRIIGLKYFNIFGPQEAHKLDMSSVIFKAYNQYKTEKRIKLFKSYKPDYKDGEQKRDFFYVKDAVKLTCYLKDHPDRIGGIYNIGSGQAHSFNSLIAAISNALDAQIKIDYIDMPDSIKDKYQYFTEANMDKLRATSKKNYPLPKLHSFEAAVRDYVVNYLENSHFQIDSPVE